MTDTLASGQSNSSMPEMSVDATELPTRGLGYPSGMKVNYRGYTFGEIKKVSTTNDIELPQIVETILAGITIEGFDKYNLSFVDVLYIGLLRRVSSQGHLKFQIPYQCDNCEQHSVALFGSGDIDFKSIDEKVKVIPIRAEIGGKEFKFSYPTARNMLDVHTLRNDKKRKKGIAAVEVQASTVVNMKFDQAYKAICEMQDSDDIESLAEIDSLLHHDIKPIEAVCTKMIDDGNGGEKKCNHTNHVSIEGKELLVRPFREGERPSRNKICLGDEQDS